MTPTTSGISTRRTTPTRRTLTRRTLAAAAASLAVAVPVLAAAPAAADPTEGSCAPGQGVTLVVDGTSVGGDVQTRCAPGDPVNGIQALRAAGFDVVSSPSDFGEYVCVIDAVGTACDAPFEGSYWAFYTADPDAAWQVSGVGASGVDPDPGDVHGWRWGAGEEPSTPAPAAGPPRPVGTGTPDPDAAAKAAAYLAGQLQDGGIARPDGGIAYDITIDAALGLLAAGTQDAALDEVLDLFERDAARYAHGQEFVPDGERTDAVYAGQVAKLGLLAELTGGDPRSVGGLDLVADLQRTEQAGRYTDISAFGDVSNVFTQAFGVLLLAEATDVEPGQAAVDVLVEAQCADGGFPVYLAQATCSSDADATGIALQALAVLDQPEADGAEARAVSFLLAAQLPDGGFSTSATGTGMPNVNSTGYAGMGLAAAGQDITSIVTWLSSVALEDGGLPVEVPGNRSDAFATSQALPALTAQGFVASAREIARPGEVVPTPTPTPTPPPTPTPTPIPAAPGDTPTSSPTGTTTTSAAAVRAGSSSGRTSATGGALARTGAAALLPLVAGGLLVALGTGAVLATRRRGNHR